MIKQKTAALLLSATLLSLTVPALAHEFFSCSSIPAILRTGLPSIVAADDGQDAGKMSRQEFEKGVVPSETLVIPQGTSLNVVVDLVCLFDPRRGPQQLPWLTGLKTQVAPPRRGSPQRSFSWQLEQDWRYEDLELVIEAEPCIELLSPEGEYEVSSVYSDPNIKDQPHLEKLRFFETFPEFLLPLMTRPKVTIAVIDSGVDFSHPDLHFNRWINPDEIPGNGLDDDDNGFVDDVNGFNFRLMIGDAGPSGAPHNIDHGTHVAGLAAARFDNGIGGVGVNGLAKIMSLPVFSATGSSNSSIENAIRYAADNKADVINLSIASYSPSRTIRSALNYAVRNGSLVVTAAGNDERELCDVTIHNGFVSPAVYASSMNGVVSVGSVDTIDGHYSAFSNYSERLVEISAPGALQGRSLGIFSTIPHNSYSAKSGTSMSAPILSGAAALVAAWLKAYGYESVPVRLEKILRESARQDPSLNGYVQHGRTLDLGNVLSYLKAHYPPRDRRPRPSTPGRTRPINSPLEPMF